MLIIARTPFIILGESQKRLIPAISEHGFELNAELKQLTHVYLPEYQLILTLRPVDFQGDVFPPNNPYMWIEDGIIEQVEAIDETDFMEVETRS